MMSKAIKKTRMEETEMNFDSDSSNYGSKQNEQEQSMFQLLPEANPIAPKHFQEELPLQVAYNFPFQELPQINYSIKSRKDVLQFKSFNSRSASGAVDINLQAVFQDSSQVVYRRTGQVIEKSLDYPMCIINLRKLIAKKKGDSVLTYKLNAENALSVHDNIDENTLIFGNSPG